MVASGKNEKTDEVKTATLLHIAGPDALYRFSTRSVLQPQAITKSWTKCWKSLKLIAYPVQTSLGKALRHIFNTRNQQSDETIDHYVTDLRNEAKTCEFGVLTEKRQ